MTSFKNVISEELKILANAYDRMSTEQRESIFATPSAPKTTLKAKPKSTSKA